MAFFGKKKNTEGYGSRYENADDLLYADENGGRSGARRRSAGYGVSDSYLRQDEFGRPEGARLSGGGYADSGDRRESGAGADSIRAAYESRSYESQTSGRPVSRPRKWESDPYDDRYTGSYDGFEEERDYGQPERRSAPPSRRTMDESRYARRTVQEQNSRRAPQARSYRGGEEPQGHYPGDRLPDDRRRKAPGRKKKKGGFVWKLVLLIIAAVLIFVFYRFSRMDRVHLGNILQNEGAATASGYQNFVIYGVDSREGELTKDSHSDTIVICSISKSTKEAKMVSVYRDTYLDNTNGEYRKATECYFFGGPERSINMLNKNLDLDIKDYVAVNFNAVIKAVDLIGGVDINVTEEELPYINGYQTENAAVTGAEITPVASAGYQHLNGIQALAYCRIRYTAGYDFKRTERQRDVLTQIFENAKKQGTAKMLQVVDAMMPYISTSFSNTELVGLVSEMSDVTLGDSAGFPFEQQAANIQAGDCVVPVNLAQNVTELHAFLFGQNDYTPSQTVQEISQQIINDTGIA